MKPILALLAFVTLSCAALNPVLKPIASCAGKAVSVTDGDEALNDLLTENWADLASEGLRLGWDVLDCVIANIETQAPGLKPSAATFRQLHSVEFRSAGAR